MQDIVRFFKSLHLVQSCVLYMQNSKWECIFSTVISTHKLLPYVSQLSCCEGWVYIYKVCDLKVKKKHQFKIWWVKVYSMKTLHLLLLSLFAFHLLLLFSSTVSAQATILGINYFLIQYYWYYKIKSNKPKSK